MEHYSGGDSVLSTSGTGVGNYYPSEPPLYSYDNNTSDQYTNFGACGLRTGFYRVLQRGSSLVTGMKICTAPNLPTRDPITITFEGSNQPASALNLGSSWTLIYSGTSGLATHPGRVACGTTSSFTNNAIWYSSYRFLVTSKRGAEFSTAHSEVQFIGY